jgi:hypothetical protein
MDRMTTEQVQKQYADYLNFIKGIDAETARQILCSGKDDKWEGETLGRVLTESTIHPNMYLPGILANHHKMSYVDHFRLSLLNLVLADTGHDRLDIEVYQ